MRYRPPAIESPRHPKIRGRRRARPSLERLEARLNLATFNVAPNDGLGLIAAIAKAGDTQGEANTIQLAAGSTYILISADNYWYGPNGLPPIVGNITIQGNGSTIMRDPNALPFRLFYVSGGQTAPSGLPPGQLTLQDLTLSGGYAQGGGSNYGGGGLGAGGAVFNMGSLTLDGVTISGNTAVGGGTQGVGTAANPNTGGYGGGGIGTNSVGDSGGGNFGPNWPNPDGYTVGGAGGGSARGGGGGGGFFLAGGNASDTTGGAGGGLTGLGGNGGSYGGGEIGGKGGDGGGGAGNNSVIHAVGGNAFGGGGNKTGGGGVGGGGGGESGGGGFGGGGGGTGLGGGGDGPSESRAGNGGFGGGGGGANTLYFGTVGYGGFGGGIGGDFSGGGGAGMGGAIFNMYGYISISNSTLANNSAVGGSAYSGANSSVPQGGSAFGGAIFNLNGTVNLKQSTVAANTLTAGSSYGVGTPNPGSVGGSAIYNLSYGNLFNGGPVTAQVFTDLSILAGDSASGAALVSNQTSGTAAVAAQYPNIVTSYDSSGGAVQVGQPFISSAPRLAQLRNNGGSVPTMALMAGSPAIDAGGRAGSLSAKAEATDARGAGFHRVIGRAVDLGAYEYQPPTTQTSLARRAIFLNGRRFTQIVVKVEGKAEHSNTPTGRVSIRSRGREIASGMLDERGEFRFTTRRSRAGGAFKAIFDGFEQGDYVLRRSSSSREIAARFLAGR